MQWKEAGLRAFGSLMLTGKRVRLTSDLAEAPVSLVLFRQAALHW